MKILRDKLATGKWELMEKYSKYSRVELEKQGGTLRDAWEENKRRLTGMVKNYSFREDELFVYRDKNIVEYEDVFAHLNGIEIKKNNAFLLRGCRENRHRL